MLFEEQFTIFLEGAQISKCEDAVLHVDGQSFRYFKISLSSNVEKVDVEVKDIEG